jgi:hypothetical protein
MYRISRQLLVDYEIESGPMCPDKKVVNGPLFGHPRPISTETGPMCPDIQQPDRTSVSVNPDMGVRRNKEVKTLKKTKATTSTGIDRIAVVKVLHEFVPAIDQGAADRLIAGCQKAAPDAATAEVEYFVRGLAARASGIKNLAGFFITQVPKCFEGDAYRHVQQELRRRQLRELEEQARIERARLENWRDDEKRRSVEAEAEHRRREEIERRKLASEELRRRGDQWVAEFFEANPTADHIPWTEIPDDLWNEVWPRRAKAASA